MVPESFAKQEKVNVDSLKPVGEQIAKLEKQLSHSTLNVLQTAVVAEIHTAVAHL